VEISELSDEDRSAFVSKYSLNATPTTMFFKDGELVEMIAGGMSIEELESMYNRFLK